MRQSYRSDCLIKRFIFCLNVQRQVRILYKKKTCGKCTLYIRQPQEKSEGQEAEKERKERRRAPRQGKGDRQTGTERNVSKHRNEQKL